MHIWGLQLGLRKESRVIINPTKYYKIMHKPTGLFKASGFNGTFNKIGKLWRGSTFKSHLRQFEQYSLKRAGVPLSDQVDNHYKRRGKISSSRQHVEFPIDECVVVEYELIGHGHKPLRDFIEKEMGK